MILTRDELQRYRPLNNDVLIKIAKPNEDTIAVGDKELYLDTTFETNQHMTVWGHVEAFTETIYFNRKSVRSADWETEVEVKKGDEVCFCFLASALALGKRNDINSDVSEDKVIECENEMFIILKYTDLILSVDGDKIKMLNGWLLLEPESEEEIKSRLIHIPEHIRKKKSVRYASVAHKGSLVNNYWNEAYSGDNFDVNVGDKVAFDKFHNIELEVEIHSRLKKNYYRMQRKDLLCVL
jgi:co-chaperonin GroES (HSP10)